MTRTPSRDIRDILPQVQLHEPTLMAMARDYLAAKAEGEITTEDIESDERLARQAMRAVADAVVLSGLAVALQQDADFRDALQVLARIEDDDLDQMRKALFRQGVASAARPADMDESIDWNAWADARIERRVLWFDEAVDQL